jgi:hypothetical protein
MLTVAPHDKHLDGHGEVFQQHSVGPASGVVGLPSYAIPIPVLLAPVDDDNPAVVKGMLSHHGVSCDPVGAVYDHHAVLRF